MEAPILPTQTATREYSKPEVVIANIPYVAMTILGAVIFAVVRRLYHPTFGVYAKLL